MLPTRRNYLLRNAALTAGFLIFTLSLTAAVQRSAAFSLNVYLPFSRAVSGALGFLFSFTSYSVAEVLALPAAALILFCLIRSIVRAVRERAIWPLLRWFSGMAAYSAGVIFLFTLLWGGAYHAPKLEARLGLVTGPAEEEILFLTAERHLEDVLRYAAMVPRNRHGAADAGDFNALTPYAVRAVKSLMESNPAFFGNAPVAPPKRALSYPILGMLGISGIYVPFTGEAVVNPISTDAFIPAVMTHELAHRLGFAPEEDANLIAYLACMASDRSIFRYSGSLLAYTYCYNALTNPLYRQALWERLSREGEAVIEDYRHNREAWAKYDGPLRERAESVNNAYLQAMGQPEGVRSYGRVVDLLIALYLEERGEH
jgi:hypothetical protein